MTMATIEIDFDIYKVIEAERRGFDEAPYLALRRLLKLPEADVISPTQNTPTDGRPWREGLIEVPHGSDARMAYQRGSQHYEGKFLDGNLVVGGRRFPTLSSAASALAQTRDGKRPSLNGWNYWEVRFPGEAKWKPMKSLRRR